MRKRGVLEVTFFLLRAVKTSSSQVMFTHFSTLITIGSKGL